MPRKGRTRARGRQGEGKGSEERRYGSCVRSLESTCGRDDATRAREGRKRGGWVSAAEKKKRRTVATEGVSAAKRIPKTGAFKSPKGILLTVTSIQRTERPGDARPPENRGHVTDPPHPDPWKKKKREKRYRYSVAPAYRPVATYRHRHVSI